MVSPAPLSEQEVPEAVQKNRWMPSALFALTPDDGHIGGQQALGKSQKMPHRVSFLVTLGDTRDAYAYHRFYRKSRVI
jgi:hypothetical protein